MPNAECRLMNGGFGTPDPASCTPRSALSRALCVLIRLYQRFVSPLLPRSCRFHPTCSEYMRRAIIEYGVLRGVARGSWRLLRCNPFNPGGYDPVKELRSADCGSRNNVSNGTTVKES